MKTETYQGGYDALLKRVSSRRAPLVYGEGEALPDLDEDFLPWRTSLSFPTQLQDPTSFAQKRYNLQTEFKDQPDLLWLHGLVIANLRKDAFPDHTPQLFQKLWSEHGDFLISRLPLRWLVSAIITFGDHGVNEAQRIAGRSVSLLFSMMKLYEFERLYSGKAPSEPYSTDHKHGAPLPLDIPAYSLKGGGLDVAILTRLWKDAQQDPVIEPLATYLLEAVNEDPGTLFRRLQSMSEERIQTLESANKNPIPVPPGHVKRNPGKITWGVATTMNEDIDQAIAFAAYHIALGADEVVLFGEDPDALPIELSAHPKITVVLVDDQIMSDAQRQRLPNRNARKAFYFNRARRDLALDWLAMLDTDEFLAPTRPIPEILSEVPADAAFLQLSVIEQFAGSKDAYRPPARDWSLTKRSIRELFPTYHAYVANLILGPSDPRLFIRAKLADIRVGNFVIKYEKRPATNGFTPADLVVAHNHVQSFKAFLDAAPRRLDQGYARRERDTIDIKTTLEALDTDPESSELEEFFTEIASARPEVISALETSGDLKRIDLELDRKIEMLIQEIAQQERLS